MKLNNFKKKLICWGAGDQAVVLQPIIARLGSQYNILIDDTPDKVSPFDNIELLSGVHAFENWLAGRNANEYGFIVAIGNPFGFMRTKIHNYLVAKGITPVSICDPSALLDENVSIGDGVQIMKGAIVNSHAIIHNQVILNTASVIEHHDELFDGVEIGPRGTLCGRVKVDKYSWICAGAVILPRLHIGKSSIVGANALVREDIPPNTVVGGVPSKFIKTNRYSKVSNEQ